MNTKEQVLQACTIHGTTVKLPNGQLDRKLYMDVAKALELIGGKWKGGKVSGFEFAEDPTELLSQIANGDQRNLKKEYQFFATPPEIAEWLVQLADINTTHRILEPSAGQGVIIKAIYKALPKLDIVDCCELMPTNKIILNSKLGVKALQVADDFLSYEYGKNYYHRIIANPPFSKNQDIDHIRKMYDCLADGGRLVSVASNHWKLSTNRKETEFRQWLDDMGASTYDIEPGKFKESGTMIGMQVVVMDKGNYQHYAKPDSRDATQEYWLKWVKSVPFSEVSFQDFLRATTSEWDDPDHKHIIKYYFDGQEIVSYASNAEPNMTPLRHWYNTKVEDCLKATEKSTNTKPQNFPQMKTNPQLLRAFQSFASQRHSLPILDSVRIENGIATISDLENWVQFPIDKPDGYYDLRMNELFYTSALNDDYPCLKLKEATSAINIKSGLILKYAPCVCEDPLRPTMESIFICGDEIIATDAHQLMLEKWTYGPIDSDFTALFRPTKPLLARCRQNKTELVKIEKCVTLDDKFQHVRFTFEDCTITIRETEGKFPQYKSVIPMWSEKELTCISLPSDTALEMAKTAKSFKMQQVYIGKLNMCIQNTDLALVKNWGAPAIVERPKREPDGLLMPLMGTKDETGQSIVDFNPIKLAKMLTEFKGSVIIGVYDPTRAMAIWLEPSGSVVQKAAQPSIPKAAAQTPKPTPAPAQTPKPTPVPALNKPEEKETKQKDSPKPIPRSNPLPIQITIVEYSEKAIAVFGDTKRHKEKMKEMYGSFNPHLKYQNEPTPGWIFSKKREAELRQLFAS